MRSPLLRHRHGASGISAGAVLVRRLDVCVRSAVLGEFLLEEERWCFGIAPAPISTPILQPKSLDEVGRSGLHERNVFIIGSESISAMVKGI